MSKIVLVDDSRANLEIYRRIVERIPQSVTVGFDSSSNALRWCRDNELDLLLIDYQMPAPNGLEFIAEFRAIPARRDTPVVMLTVEQDTAVRRRALDLGANDFLIKPVDPVELIARCRNLLALRTSQVLLADRAAQLAHEVSLATRMIQERELETIVRLSRIAELRDSDTGQHIMRMGKICGVIAAGFGLPRDEVELISLAAPMHDIGKIGIPDNILLKPASLTAEEFAVMKRHTLIGFEMLSGSASAMLQCAAEIARWHHERFDGTGYPDGLVGEEIPVAARVCAVSDVFDALTSKRPYKEPWPVEAAVVEIARLSGTFFDPVLVEAFQAGMRDIEEIRRRYAA